MVAGNNGEPLQSSQIIIKQKRIKNLELLVVVHDIVHLRLGLCKQTNRSLYLFVREGALPQRLAPWPTSELQVPTRRLSAETQRLEAKGTLAPRQLWTHIIGTTISSQTSESDTPHGLESPSLEWFTRSGHLPLDIALIFKCDYSSNSAKLEKRCTPFKILDQYSESFRCRRLNIFIPLLDSNGQCSTPILGVVLLSTIVSPDRPIG